MMSLKLDLLDSISFRSEDLGDVQVSDAAGGSPDAYCGDEANRDCRENIGPDI